MRRLVLICSLLASVPNTCCADLLITLKEVGANRVRVSWSGSGTIQGASTIGTVNNLDFVDFLGASPFGPDITPDGSGSGHDFALAATTTPLTLTITPSSGSPIVTTYDTIRLDNEGVSSDFSLVGVGPILPFGEPYEASGSALVELEQGGSGENLSFSDLNPGSYFTNTSFDAAVFGGVTLEVVSVPEASAVLFGTSICGLFGLRSGLRRNFRDPKI